MRWGVLGRALGQRGRWARSEAEQSECELIQRTRASSGRTDWQRRPDDANRPVDSPVCRAAKEPRACASEPSNSWSRKLPGAAFF